MTKTNKQKADVATSLVTSEQLKLLLKKTENSYYFLKYPHRVSGFITQMPDNLAPEGQIFNTQQEIRWKKQGDKFDVLCLTIGKLTQDIDWQSIDKNHEIDWSFSDRPAKIYPETETRLPKKIINQIPKDQALKQRYFIDRNTATIHFVALTLTP